MNYYNKYRNELENIDNDFVSIEDILDEENDFELFTIEDDDKEENEFFFKLV